MLLKTYLNNISKRVWVKLRCSILLFCSKTIQKKGHSKPSHNLIISVYNQYKMQKGYKILISSGIMLSASITIFFIWGITFSEFFITNNHSFFINQINLPSIQSYNSSIYINSTNKLLTLTIKVNNNGSNKI